MEALKSYLFTAMMAALASSIVIRISDPKYRSYIRFGAGLCLLLVLITPLTGLAGEFADDLEEDPTLTQSMGESAFMGEMGRTMSAQIGDLLAQRFGIQREYIAVKLTLDLADLSAISIVRVDVTVSTACDAEAVRAYLAEALGCTVTVNESED